MKIQLSARKLVDGHAIGDPVSGTPYEAFLFGADSHGVIFGDSLGAKTRAFIVRFYSSLGFDCSEGFGRVRVSWIGTESNEFFVCL